MSKERQERIAEIQEQMAYRKALVAMEALLDSSSSLTFLGFAEGAAEATVLVECWEWLLHLNVREDHDFTCDDGQKDSQLLPWLNEALVEVNSAGECYFWVENYGQLPWAHLQIHSSDWFDALNLENHLGDVMVLNKEQNRLVAFTSDLDNYYGYVRAI